MKELAGRTAFVTDGASLIGLGMAQAFLERGRLVAMADIQLDHLDEAKALQLVSPIARDS